MILTRRPRVAIVGAGYGGLSLALRLARQARWGVRIDLVDGHTEHHLITRLHEVAVGRLAPGAVAIPLGRLVWGTPIRVRGGWVEGIDLQRGRLQTNHGRLEYATLVLAPGAQTDFHGVPGVYEHGLPLRTLDDAVRLRQTVVERVSRAAQLAGADRVAALSLVIVGGGYTGVELAGELSDWVPRLARRFGVSPLAVRIQLLEAADRLLPGHDAWLAARAADRLETLGVEVLLSTPVVEVDGAGVRTRRAVIAARTVIWTTGARGPAWLAQSGLTVSDDGRVLVDRYLAARGQDAVLAIGDAARLDHPSATDTALPASAQIAVQQAVHLSRILSDVLRGRRAEPFVPRLWGEALSLGPRTGLGRVGGVPLDNLAALAVKRLAQARYLDGLGGPALNLRQLAVGHTLRPVF